MALGVGAFWGGCHNPNGRNDDNQYSNYDNCSVNGTRMFFIDIAASIDQWHDDINAISTAAMAIFTVVLVYVTRQQAKLTKRSADIAARSADIAEKALLDLEAPFVTFKIVEPGINIKRTVEETGEFGNNLSPGNQRKKRMEWDLEHMEFVFVNHGRTPAQLIGYIPKFQRVDKKNPIPEPVNPLTVDPEYELLPEGIFVMAARESEPRYIRPPVFNPGTQDLWIIGYVKYRDIFNRNYISGFSFVFAVESNRFILAGGNAYNYRCREEEIADKSFAPTPD